MIRRNFLKLLPSFLAIPLVARLLPKPQIEHDGTDADLKRSHFQDYRVWVDDSNRVRWQIGGTNINLAPSNDQSFMSGWDDAWRLSKEDVEAIAQDLLKRA